MTKERLSPKQIKNWRRVLATMFGPYALSVPDEEIQAMRDAMQKVVDRESQDKGESWKEERA